MMPVHTFSTVVRLLAYSLMALAVPLTAAELPQHKFIAAPLISKGENLHAFSENFAHYYQQRLAQENIPGGAFAIVHNNRIIKMQGVGVRASKDQRKVDQHTVFRLASVSKTFTGALTSLIINESDLNWQDPLKKHLPDFTLADSRAAEKITLHHLLSHSTGLMPNSYDNLLNAHLPLTKIHLQFSRLQPICHPGECYGYQNIAFSLIENVLSQQTGKSYQQLLEERFFAPLAMKNASVSRKAFLDSANKAMPHVKVSENRWQQIKVRNNYYQVPSAAGVNASIDDLAKWLIANMGNNPDILPEKALAQITRKNTFTRKDLFRKYWREHLNEAHYGLGWRIYNFDGNTLIYHAGWVAGFRAEIAYSPELKIGLAMLINAESGVTSDISTRFWQSIFSQPQAINCRNCEVKFSE
jgi:beta-lactamase class C